MNEYIEAYIIQSQGYGVPTIRLTVIFWVSLSYGLWTDTREDKRSSGGNNVHAWPRNTYDALAFFAIVVTHDVGVLFVKLLGRHLDVDQAQHESNRREKQLCAGRFSPLKQLSTQIPSVTNSCPA